MKRLTICLLSVLMGLILASSARAATAGKVAGVVTNAVTGEPIEGVRVMLEGTQQSGTTNAEGRYVILAVDPGVHAFTAVKDGYESGKQEQVQILPDYTSTVDFALTESPWGTIEWILVGIVVVILGVAIRLGRGAVEKARGEA